MLVLKIETNSISIYLQATLTRDCILFFGSNTDHKVHNQIKFDIVCELFIGSISFLVLMLLFGMVLILQNGVLFLYFAYKYQLWLRFILLFDPLVFFYVMLRNIYKLPSSN
ncbi:F5O11.18 [Arabidopsis thaliana]|uniref:F5O11.18 n=1 Tax=Arabidopsis thaliana TaxID=3702 RepID=Q9LNA1_ARATH|nr:F5O11.18 [Arabidopsis thaliana]